jgi:hypothetical protein
MPAITGNPGPPANAGFIPTSVAGCALWLDAADSSTIIGTTSVTAWNDKSGLGNSPTFGTNKPSFIGNYIDTANTNVDFTIPISTINTTSGQGGVLFFVFADKQENPNYPALFSDGNPYNRFYQILLNSYGYEVSGNKLSQTGVNAMNTTNFIVYVYSYIVASSITVRVNGSEIISSSSGPPNPSGQIYIGKDGWGDGTGNLKLKEILFYKSSLITSQIQEVEGYLAQKWGLTGPLPSGHPGLTTNYISSQPPVFRIGPLPGNRTPFSVTGNQYVIPIVYTLTVAPVARYSFLTAPSGTITNTGSSGSIGAATIVSATYTATAPSYITFALGTGYILAPSITGIQTLILIVKVRDAGASNYLLDARSGLANGWLYSGGPPIGPDWTSATYYKDAVNTVFTGNPTQALQDSTWHHVCLQRASFTSAITFLARFTQNETLGCDCGEIMIFTSALTAQQVKDNYNFFSSRFGWTPV